MRKRMLLAKGAMLLAKEAMLLAKEAMKINRLPPMEGEQGSSSVGMFVEL
jgi:hypothetical protein